MGLRIEDFSGDKIHILEKDGVFVVKACAGSGKTCVVAAKISSLLRKWESNNRGIAAISFTNVAWQEIEDKLKKDFGVDSGLDYPHFIGTIDSFIDTYLLLPFGHLVLNCENRPEIIMNWEPEIRGKFECKKSGCKLSNLSYDINGNLISYSDSSHFSNCSLSHRYCKASKIQLRQSGYLTQADANFFVMKLLEKYPDIAKAIVYRFPVFLIDEAQDTSDIQMKIFDLLLENGLERLMLIGDPNQAIYEWRTANPEVFIRKEIEWETLNLHENWRSSKEICAFTDKIVSNDYVSTACNEEIKDFNFKPEIWGYDVNESLNLETNRLIQEFIRICIIKGISINKEKVAILVRGKDILTEIRNQGDFIRKEPWKEQIRNNGKPEIDVNRIHYRNISKSKYLFDKKEYKESFRLLEKTIFAIKNGKKYVSNDELKEFIEQIDFKKWRIELFDLLTRLPNTDVSLKEWVDLANEVIRSDCFFGISDFEIKIKKGTNEIKFGQIFVDKEVETENYTLGTVHSVKGRTFEAVLLILKEKAYRNKRYVDLINENINDNEEKRIIYVGTTRPQKILVIAVPESDKKAWESKFYGNSGRKQKQLDLSAFTCTNLS